MSVWAGGRVQQVSQGTESGKDGNASSNLPSTPGGGGQKVGQEAEH